MYRGCVSFYDFFSLCLDMRYCSGRKGTISGVPSRCLHLGNLLQGAMLNSENGSHTLSRYAGCAAVDGQARGIEKRGGAGTEDASPPA